MFDRYSILLSIGIVIFLAFNIPSLKEGHHWGPDYARFILHSLNIVAGRDYSYNLPDLYKDYPPGYPVIISPIILFFGVDYVKLKSVNILFWILYTVICYKILVRLHGKGYASSCSLLLLTSPWFFFFKQNIISDIPYSVFTLSSVFLLGYYFKERKNLYLHAGLIFLYLSMITKFSSIIIFPVILVFILYQRNDYHVLIQSLFVFLLVFATFYIFDASVLGYYSSDVFDIEYTKSPLVAIPESIIYTQAEIIHFLFPLANPLILNTLGILLFLIITAVLANKTRFKRLSFYDFFFIGYLSMITFYPWNVGPLVFFNLNPRYILPILPFVAIYICEGLTYLASFAKKLECCVYKGKPYNLWIILVVLGFLLMHNILIMLALLDYNDDNILREDTQEMVDWINNNIPISDNIVFYKPPDLVLLTNHGNVFLPLEMVAFPEKRRIQKNTMMDWFISHRKTDGNFYEPDLTKDDIQLLYENDGYKIFKIKPNDV